MIARFISLKALLTIGFSFTQDSSAINNLEVKLPVRWDITKASNYSRAAIESETFAENWVFIREPNNSLYLQSPRAQVEAFAFGQTDKLSKLPSKILIKGHDLAQLLGIRTLSQAPMRKQDVILSLTAGSLPSFQFQTPSDQRVQVNLSINN